MRFRLKHGFWYQEIWNLDQTITKFVLPRLKCLREGRISELNSARKNGLNDEDLLDCIDYIKILDEIIIGFETHNDLYLSNSLEQEKIDKGLKLFAQYYCTFWN